MGKIYRIPIPRRLKSIPYRRKILLVGVVSIFVTLMVGAIVPSGTAQVAAKTLAYGLACLFVISLFWDEWSETSSKLTIVTSIAAVLVCIGLSAKRVHDVQNPAYKTHTAFQNKHTNIVSIWSAPRNVSKQQHEVSLQSSPARFVGDLAPFGVPILVFLFAAYSAHREDYDSAS